VLPTDIDSVDDIKLWIAADEVRREGHDKFNDKIEKRVYSLEKRISAVERRIMWISGASAAFGSILGQNLPSLFGG